MFNFFNHIKAMYAHLSSSIDGKFSVAAKTKKYIFVVCIILLYVRKTKQIVKFKYTFKQF